MTGLVDSPRQYLAHLLNELAAKSGALSGLIRKWQGLSIPARLRHAREKEPDEKDHGHTPPTGCAERTRTRNNSRTEKIEIRPTARDRVGEILATPIGS